MAGYLIGINNLQKLPWVWNPAQSSRNAPWESCRRGGQAEPQPSGLSSHFSLLRPSGGSGMLRARRWGRKSCHISLDFTAALWAARPYSSCPHHSQHPLLSKTQSPHVQGLGPQLVSVPQWPGLLMSAKEPPSPDCFWVSRSQPWFVCLLVCFYCSIADLQCCVSFWCRAKWFSYIYILFQILFHYSLLQDIEYSSLYYTVGPCWLSILYVIVCIF